MLGWGRRSEASQRWENAFTESPRLLEADTQAALNLGGLLSILTEWFGSGNRPHVVHPDIAQQGAASLGFSWLGSNVMIVGRVVATRSVCMPASRARSLTWKVDAHQMAAYIHGLPCVATNSLKHVLSVYSGPQVGILCILGALGIVGATLDF